MSYFVQWVASAHERLEQLWMAADDKSAVLRATNAIDDLLAEDPYRSETAISGTERTIVCEPLSADFRVSNDGRVVLVLSVWWIGYLDDDEE